MKHTLTHNASMCNEWYIAYGHIDDIFCRKRDYTQQFNVMQVVLHNQSERDNIK